MSSDISKIENIFIGDKLNASIEELIELDIKYFIITFINICKFYIIDPLNKDLKKGEKEKIISILDELTVYTSKYKSRLGDAMFSSMVDILASIRLNIDTIIDNNETISGLENNPEFTDKLKEEIIQKAKEGVTEYIKQKEIITDQAQPKRETPQDIKSLSSTKQESYDNQPEKISIETKPSSIESTNPLIQNTIPPVAEPLPQKLSDPLQDQPVK